MFKNKLYTFLTLSLLCVTCIDLSAQTRVIPAPVQSSPILLQGAIAHLGNGERIDNAIIAFEDSKITLVGDAAGTTFNAEDYTVVDVSGKHIYPGFISPNSDIGLVEVSSVSATIDNEEQGDFTPNVRSIIAYNTDSELIPTMRFNGILMAQPTPDGGIVSGTSSIVQLDAWNWEDAAYKVDEGVHLYWPRKSFPPRWWRGETETRKNESYDSHVAEWKVMLKDAKAYSELVKPEISNLKLASLKGLFDGSLILYIHAEQAKSIMTAVQLAEDHGIKKIAIVGGNEAMLIKEFLIEKEIPIILADIHRLPDEDHEDTVYPFKLAKELSDAGILYCLAYDNLHSSRNLPFTAGTTVAYGVDYEQAVQSISLNAAKIFGIDDQTGSLEVGKDATLFVSEGDALDMRTNKLTHAFIQGREIQLEARQQFLYKKYADKYGHDIE